MNIDSRLLTGQAIILAAGESSRFWPLNQKHKSLQKIGGRPFICYTIENLKKAGIREIIIVQSRERDVEKELKNHSFSNLNIKYALQENPSGTAHAIKAAEAFLRDKFLVLNGDDFYEISDIQRCLKRFPSMLVKGVENPSGYGVIIQKRGCLAEIVEKSNQPPTNLINCGLYFLPKSIFKEKIEKSSRGEYEITDYLRKLSKKTKVFLAETKNWFPLNYPWDLLSANEFFFKKIKRKIEGKIEKNCQILGKVVVGAGTIVKSGSYLKGPIYVGKNSQVGPNCYLRPFTSIDDNCRIGQAVEIKNSIIGSNSRIAHLSYVGDSVVGENCILGGGTIIANFRFDQKNVRSVVKGKLVDTQRQKFGAVLGSGTKIGINASLMPGVLIGSNCQIGPHSLVMENIKNNEIFYAKFQKIIRKIDKKP